MAWRIELDAAAERDLDRLDRRTAARIVRFLEERIASSENPRTLGEALKGPALHGLWRYRVGDYRIVARIQDETISILVVKIGHRREVYRK